MPVKLTPLVLATLCSANIGCNVKKADNKKKDVVNTETNYEIITQDINVNNLFIENDKVLEESNVTEVIEEKLEETNENNLEVIHYLLAKENIKIYSSPSTSSDKIGIFFNGNTVQLLNTLEDNWYEIKYNGESAYIKSDNIEFIDSYENPNNIDIPIINSDEDINNILEETKNVVATSKVNIREKMSTNSHRIGQLNKGDSLPLIKVHYEWCEVNYYGKSAYVYREYVKESSGYYSKTDMYDMIYTTRKVQLFDINTNEVLKEIPKHEVAEVYAKKDNYYLVRCGGTFGYILEEYTTSLGDTYVIIDISSQNLKLYVNDKLVVDTRIVTGKDSSPTYCGIFDIRKKEKNVHWDEFNVTVKYWLPFNRGEGIHDAKWRKDKEFGSDIYHKDGSHGCVNIPKDIMKDIYDNVEIGTPVLVKK